MYAYRRGMAEPNRPKTRNRVKYVKSVLRPHTKSEYTWAAALDPLSVVGSTFATCMFGKIWECLVQVKPKKCPYNLICACTEHFADFAASCEETPPPPPPPRPQAGIEARKPCNAIRTVWRLRITKPKTCQVEPTNSLEAQPGA